MLSPTSSTFTPEQHAAMPPVGTPPLQLNDASRASPRGAPATPQNNTKCTTTRGRTMTTPGQPTRRTHEHDDDDDYHEEKSTMITRSASRKRLRHDDTDCFVRGSAACISNVPDASLKSANPLLVPSTSSSQPIATRQLLPSAAAQTGPALSQTQQPGRIVTSSSQATASQQPLPSAAAQAGPALTQSQQSPRTTRLTTSEKRRRFPLSVKEGLSIAQIRSTLRNAAVGNAISVEWFYEGEKIVHQDNGVIVKVNDQQVEVCYDELGVLVIPSQDPTVGFLKVEIVMQHNGLKLPPLTSSNRPVDKMPDNVIWCDGGTSTKLGDSAAAVVLWRTRDDSRETHSLFAAASTSQTMEWIAFVAAVRLAHATPGNTLIITDCRGIYDNMTGSSTMKAAHLVSLSNIAKQLYATCAVNVTIAHMFRDNKNAADEVVTQTRLRGVGHGDAALFPIPPTCSTKLQRRVKITEEVEEIVKGHEIDVSWMRTVEDFAIIRRFKSRSRCPDYVLAHWSALTKLYLQKIIGASNMTARDEAVRQFLILPISYLPNNVATKRVSNHLKTRSPFSIKPDQNACDDDDDAKNNRTIPVSKTERLEKSVVRLARDRKIKAALKLLSLEEIGGDINEETKLMQLRGKFIAPTGPMRDIERKPTPIFSTSVVAECLKQVRRDSASCICSWSRDLLWQAIQGDGTILDDVATLLKMIIDGDFSDTTMDILLAARLVGIPKASGGIRPICVSSLFIKLLGLCVLKVTGAKNSSFQYATGKKGGTTDVVHQTREFYQEGKVIIRIDSSNAFNVAPRHLMATLIKEDEVLQFFRCIYSKPSNLVVYAPGGKFNIIQQNEGVRQGDALSAHLFCLVMDKICEDIAALHPSVKAMCYMDDLTLACDPGAETQLIRDAVNIMKKYGMRPNESKSSVTAKDGIDLTACGLTVERGESIIILGGVINNVYDQYNDTIKQRVALFFDALCKINLHPQLRLTILRLCGSPKLIHYCSVTPPNFSLDNTQLFDLRIRDEVKKIVGCEVAEPIMYDKMGLGMPNYVKNREEIFNFSFSLCKHTTNTAVRRLDLTTNLFGHSVSMRSQHDARWLFYAGQTPASSISESQFRTAIQIRCRALSEAHLPQQCICGFCIAREGDLITHAFKCDNYSTYGKVQRHNLLRDTIIDVAASFGITTTKEPTFYKYDQNIAQRPDITFHLPRPIVTDVTIVNSEHDVGMAAEAAASAKIKIHKSATEALGHLFIPFATEIWGHMDKSCSELTTAITEQLPRHRQYAFRFEFLYAASIALAKGRAMTILAENKRRFAE